MTYPSWLNWGPVFVPQNLCSHQVQRMTYNVAMSACSRPRWRKVVMLQQEMRWGFPGFRRTGKPCATVRIMVNMLPGIMVYFRGNHPQMTLNLIQVSELLCHLPRYVGIGLIGDSLWFWITLLNIGNGFQDFAGYQWSRFFSSPAAFAQFFGDGDFHESDIHFTSTAPFVLGVALSSKNTPSV